MSKVIVDGVRYAPIHDLPENKNTYLSVLNYRFDSDAGEGITIRDYLARVLLKFWDEGEGFNSKRPYGNSDWAWRLYEALVQGKFISGTLDSDGRIDTFNKNEANQFVEDLILVMCYGAKDERTL